MHAAWDHRRVAPHLNNRNPHLDNLKAVLVVLVVTGHLLGQTLGTAPGARTAYTAIYLFHMPAFALLSGALSAQSVDSRRATGLIRNLLLPYLIFQVIYVLYFDVVGPGMSFADGRMFSPMYHLWFLVALLAWRLAAPLFSALRPSIAIGLAIGMSLLAGSASSITSTLALNRTLGYLPFFVVGLVLRERILSGASPRLPTRVTAVAVLLLAAPLGHLINTRSSYELIYWVRTYESLGVGFLEGASMRLGLVIAGLALTWATFVLVPRGRSALTGIGYHSMYPYLLHGMITVGIGWAGLGRRLDHLLSVPVLVVLAGVLTLVLTLPPVTRILRPIVAPTATGALAK